MATNYSSWGWSGSGYGERIYLEVTQSAQDITNNRTTFNYKIYNNSNNSYGDTGPITWRIADPWNSSRVSGTRANTPTTGHNQVKTYAEGTFNIQHNADGTLGSVKFTLHISRNLGNTKSATVDVTLTVPTIPRTSTFTIPTSFTVGSAFTVTISRASSSFTHLVRFSDGSTVLFETNNSVGTSQNVNVAANTLLASMSGVASKVFIIEVHTYSNGNWIGYTTKNITAIIPLSTFTIPSSFNVGSAFTASISRVGSSLTHEISLFDGSTGVYWSGNIFTTSGSPNIPADTLIARMSGVASKAFTVRVTTFNGSTYIGTTSKTITAHIPVSTFTIPESFTMGSAFTVSISRVGSLTHAVTMSDGAIDLYWSGFGVTTSASANAALSLLAARSPSAMSKYFTVKVDTYNGNTHIGRQAKNIKAYVPGSVKPTFGAVTASEANSTQALVHIGAYVQTKSKLNLAITGASGIYGSTILSYNITGVGYNANSSSTVTGFVSVSGNQTITGTIIDSRGQTFSKSIVINILPYTPPTLSDLSFKRTLSNKTEAPLGDNVTVRANIKVQSLVVNGVEKNAITYQVQSAQSGGSFTDKDFGYHNGLTMYYSNVWVGYSVDHAYDFRFRVGDTFDYSGWFVGKVPTGIVTQQWSSKTTSFGKMIDNTGYNIQVGTGGLQSDGPIINKSGNEVIGVGNFIPVNIIVGGLSTQTISPTTYGVRLNVKLGSQDYHNSAYIPRELFQRWILVKDNSNNSVLFRVTSTSKIELWSGSAAGSAITGFYEYK